MPGLIEWKNQEINKLRRDMDRLFYRLWDDFSVPLMSTSARETPFIDITETEDNLIINAEIPGIEPEDLDISVTEDILTIKGEMKSEISQDKGNYRRMERRYGAFSRTLQLPCKVKTEDVKARYKKGILHIALPKCKPDTPRQVKIRIK